MAHTLMPSAPRAPRAALGSGISARRCPPLLLQNSLYAIKLRLEIVNALQISCRCILGPRNTRLDGFAVLGPFVLRIRDNGLGNRQPDKLGDRGSL